MQEPGAGGYKHGLTCNITYVVVVVLYVYEYIPVQAIDYFPHHHFTLLSVPYSLQYCIV
jgi:hypothetical protein